MKIDGKEIAQKIFGNLIQRVATLSQKKIIPHLAIILVGDDPASASYVRQKELKASLIGVKTITYNLPSTTTQDEIAKLVKDLNDAQLITGIIVQRPLPNTIDGDALTDLIDEQKDIDAFKENSPYPMPLAAAVLHILEHIFDSSIKLGAKIDQKFIEWLKNQSVIVIGKGETGGGPTIDLLRKLGAQPVVIDSKTQNPNKLLKTADIVISAVGKSHVISGSAIKAGSILISVGMHKEGDGKLHGDYEEDDIKDIVGWYTPIPGGVGPVNVAMLLENLVQGAENSIRKRTKS